LTFDGVHVMLAMPDQQVVEVPMSGLRSFDRICLYVQTSHVALVQLMECGLPSRQHAFLQVYLSRRFPLERMKYLRAYEHTFQEPHPCYVAFEDEWVLSYDTGRVCAGCWQHDCGL
jgi:hypothetical protein